LRRWGVGPIRHPSCVRRQYPSPSFIIFLAPLRRFVQNQNDMTMDNTNSMDIDVDIPDATPGVPPPSADDAILPLASLSERSCITTPRDSRVPAKAKITNKRELVDDLNTDKLAKKPASANSAALNKVTNSGQSAPSPSLRHPRFLSRCTVTAVRTNLPLSSMWSQRRIQISLIDFILVASSCRRSRGTSWKLKRLGATRYLFKQILMKQRIGWCQIAHLMLIT